MLDTHVVEYASRGQRILQRTLPILVLGMLLPPHGAAQENSESAALDEVVVTAQRREQSLQDVPVSVSVIGEDDIVQRQLTSFVDFLDTVPNVSLADNGPDNRRNGRRNIAIRGIAPGERRETVAVYVGESPLLTGDPYLFDINRIEVLRGPQGTLYGKATTAGAVKIVPNEPDASGFSGVADARVSSYGSSGSANYEGQGVVNIPLIDDVLAFRASAGLREMSGYIDAVRPDTIPTRVNPDNIIESEDINDETHRAVRLSLKYAPNDSLTVLPSFHFQDYEADSRTSSQAVGVGDLERVLEALEPADSDLSIASLDIIYDLGPWQFTSITSRVQSDFLGLEELSTTIRAALRVDETVITIPALVEFGSDREELTQELRAAYGNDRANVVLGLFYSDLDSDTTSFYADPRIIDLVGDPDNVNEQNAPGGLLVQSLNMTEEEELSYFIDVSYRLTDRLELLAGLRYYDFETSFQSTTGGRIFGGGPANSIIGPFNEATDDGTVPKVGFNFEVNDDLLVYALYSEGFRLGGTNNPLPDTPQCNEALEAIGLPDGAPPGYGAEALDNFEIGVKSQFAQGRVTLNVTAFDMEWSDLQETTRPSADCTFSFVNNIGAAESTGFEAELSAQITSRFYLGIGIGYIDAKVSTDPAPGSTVQKRKGDPLTDVADRNYNAVAEYTWPVSFAGGGDAYVRFDYSYVGERFRDFGISPGINPDYQLTNGRFGLRGEKWEAALFVQNIFDEIETLDVFGSRRFTTRPRTVGVNARFFF